MVAAFPLICFIYVADRNYYIIIINELLKRYTGLADYIKEIQQACYENNYGNAALVAKDILKEIQTGGGLGSENLLKLFKKRKY